MKQFLKGGGCESFNLRVGEGCQVEVDSQTIVQSEGLRAKKGEQVWVDVGSLKDIE